MKRLFSLLMIMTILVGAAKASDRKESEMRAIAIQQLFGSMTRNGFGDTKINLVKKDRYLSVYSAEHRGFVVISRDNTFPAILGMSDSRIDDNNLPDGFRWWLVEVSRSMRERLETGNWYSRTRSAMAVKPLIETRWNQVTPYNLKCPKISEKNCPTGCVATAAAQIMKYFNYPAQGKGIGIYQIDGQAETGEINSIYDWGNMKNTYSKALKELTAETEAVATLMFDAGVSSGMNYSDKGSASSLIQCAQGFVDHFEYDSLSLQFMSRLFYNETEWKGTMIEELVNKRPILYSGNPEDQSTGHAFIFDGIDDDGLVHVNWGWGGNCDGYFDIFILVPGKGADQDGDYSYYNQAIIGFNPTNTPDEGTEEHSTWVSDTICRFSIDEADSLVLTARGIFNLSYRSFRGKLLVTMDHTNGREEDSWSITLYNTEAEDCHPVRSLYGFVFNDDDRDQYGSEKIFGLASDDIIPGKYIVTLATQALHEKEPSPIRYYDGIICQYTLVKDDDGSITIKESIPLSIDQVRSDHRLACSKVYDLHGQQASDGMRKGIYIQNGKKIIR